MVYSCNILLCDFAKRAPAKFSLEHGHRQCSRKKTIELGVLLGVSREPRPRPIREWVADLFCVKTRGVGRGDFVTLIRSFMSESSAKSENFSCGLGQPNQCGDS